MTAHSNSRIVTPIEIDFTQRLLTSPGLSPGLSAPPSAPTYRLRRATRSPLADTLIHYPDVVRLGRGSDHSLYTGVEGSLDGGGLFIATCAPTAVGELVSCVVAIPLLVAQLHVVGTTRWVRELSAAVETIPGMGLQLHALTPQQRALLQRYLDTIEPMLWDDHAA